jgi:hypothetical protein
MKIAIISDTHDHLINIKKALEIIKQENIPHLIHLGDVCAPFVLKEIASRFLGQIHLTFGNVDGDKWRMTELSKTELTNVKIYGERGEIVLENKKIAFTHFPFFGEALASTEKYDIAFYGHTHKKDKRKIKKTILLNPGTLAGYSSDSASFIIYNLDTDQIEFKTLS